MLEIIQLSGCVISAVLCILALYIRYVDYIDTNAYSVDWSLLLIAFAGIQLFLYFVGITYVEIEARAGLVVSAAVCYILALLLWFFNVRKNKSGKMVYEPKL